MPLTDRRLFPQALSPKPRGRPLYPFLSSLAWGKKARTLQVFVLTVSVERPQLFAVRADTQIWTRQIPVSVNKSWCLALECLHGPAACPRTAHLRGKETACPACSPGSSWALAMLPIPQYPFPTSSILLPHHPSLFSTGPIHLTKLPVQFSPLLQRDNAKALKSSSNPRGRGAMRH